VNSRVRSTPARGRGSSRSLVWIWYRNIGSSRYERISRATWWVMASSWVIASTSSESFLSRSLNSSGIS
jgi:hypothetical protein